MADVVSIIIPTRNEERCIARLIDDIWQARLPLRCELVVVDDSTDNTTKVAEGKGARVVRGQGKGLGQAIIDGIEASMGDVIVVMDADGQHPPSSIPDLLKPILQEGMDMTIGSRYVKGGGSPEWKFSRRVISKVACLIAEPMLGIKDATSGFFAFRKSILNE